VLPVKKLNQTIITALIVFGIFSSATIAFGEVSQDNNKGFGIGQPLTLLLFDSNLNFDSDQAETHSLDLIRFESDKISTTLGPKGGVQDAFNPRPSALRETGDNTGIFYTVIEIPRSVNGQKIGFGEKIVYFNYLAYSGRSFDRNIGTCCISNGRRRTRYNFWFICWRDHTRIYYHGTRNH